MSDQKLIEQPYTQYVRHRNKDGQEVIYAYEKVRLVKPKEETETRYYIQRQKRVDKFGNTYIKEYRRPYVGVKGFARPAPPAQS